MCYSFSAFTVLSIGLDGFDYSHFISLLRYFPLTLLLTFTYEKQTRENFKIKERERHQLYSKAQISDILDSPIMIINKNGNILHKNICATRFLEEKPTRNIISLIAEQDHFLFEELLTRVLINEPPINKRIQLTNSHICEVSLQGIIWEKTPSILLMIFYRENMQILQKNVAVFNKNLGKMTTSLLENMEMDYNKWSNLQSLKYIKQSDLKILANCVMQANFLKCQIHANHDKTKILANSQFKKLKSTIFHIKNTILHILEIVSVLANPRHQEIKLKFEDSFPEKVTGDYNRFKEIFLMIWRQISLNYEKATFQMECRLKEFSKNSFILVFLIVLPADFSFFSLLIHICEDETSLFDSIINQNIDKALLDLDLLMLKPMISLLSGKISFEADCKTLFIEIPLEPAGELDAKKGILNNKNPFSLTFCRTNPDKNSYKWKEAQFISEKEMEKPRVKHSGGVNKFKKIVYLKESSKGIHSISSNEENENAIEQQHAIHHQVSSKEFSEKVSSPREESPEFEQIKVRKKTTSCFSSNFNNQNSTVLEESKGEIDFLTPVRIMNNSRMKAIIQEDLKDIEVSPFSAKFKKNSEFHLEKEKIQEELPPVIEQINKIKQTKKSIFERGVYESLLHCWKAHEKALKKTLMVSVCDILEQNGKGKEIKFRKEKIKRLRRNFSLPLINLDDPSLINRKYSKTPYWQLSSRKRISGLMKEENLGRGAFMEKLTFLSSRIVVSPRPILRKDTMSKKSNYFGIKSNSNPILEVLINRNLVTQRRKWISEK